MKKKEACAKSTRPFIRDIFFFLHPKNTSKASPNRFLHTTTTATLFFLFLCKYPTFPFLGIYLTVSFFLFFCGFNIIDLNFIFLCKNPPKVWILSLVLFVLLFMRSISTWDVCVFSLFVVMLMFCISI